jgi:hypothetical protein
MLERGGYGSASQIRNETDIDRLAIRSGLESQKAQEIHAAAGRFLTEEWPPIEESIRANRAAAHSAETETNSGDPEATP